MKFVALVSGGKDSFYAVLEAIRQGHELVACGHLAPRRPEEDQEEEEEESYMYQTAASECIPTLVEECLGVPLFMRECKGRSKDTSLVYDHTTSSNTYDESNHQSTDDAAATATAATDPSDEVEDLYLLLESITSAHPEITAVTSGAILSTYQRTRIESVCSRLNLTPLSYMWRIGPQRSLLQCMLEDGIDAVLVKVASPPGLVPHRHLNKSLAELFYSGHFGRLKERFDFHICGEGGEYETLVLDTPIFKKRLLLDQVSVIDTDDGVGVLRVDKCHAEEKEGGDVDDAWRDKDPLHSRVREMDGEPIVCVDDEDAAPAPQQDAAVSNELPRIKLRHLPHVKALPGGLAHVSEILSSSVSPAQSSDADTEADLAVKEALDILSTLRATLSRLPGGGATPQDVVYVHLYLSNISHFAKINKHYRAFFGTVLPPSRSCVAVGNGVLPGGRRVMLDCMVQRGSGRYMRPASNANDDFDFVKAARANPHHALRSTLHVQSISHWAPVCVGPYSQANTIRGGITFLAGQIGLDPPIMKLTKGGWKAQLKQSWTNAASVLDALGGSLADCLSGLVYVGSDIVVNEGIWDEAEKICRRALETNGNVAAGYVDEVAGGEADKYGGYEDEGTWREMREANGTNETAVIDATKSDLPLLMVALPQMPVGAIAEVELVCASSRASSCLGCLYSSSNVAQTQEADTCSSGIDFSGALSWDAGFNGDHEDIPSNENVDANVTIMSSVGLVGNGCAAVACTAAYATPTCNDMYLDTTRTLLNMLDCALACLEETARVEKSFVLNVRLYYNATNGGYDGVHLRSELNAAVASMWTEHSSVPATTIVPVTAMKVVPSSRSIEVPTGAPFYAMQVLAIDSVHLETDMWIH